MAGLDYYGPLVGLLVATDKEFAKWAYFYDYRRGIPA